MSLPAAPGCALHGGSIAALQLRLRAVQAPQVRWMEETQGFLGSQVCARSARRAGRPLRPSLKDQLRAANKQRAARNKQRPQLGTSSALPCPTLP